MPKKRSGKVARKTPVVKKTKDTKVSKKVVKPKFTLEVYVNDIVYKGSAPDLRTAVNEFVNHNPNYPFSIKTRAILRFGNGKVERQVIWPTVRARRMFKIFSMKPDRAELFADKFNLMLSDDVDDKWQR